MKESNILYEKETSNENRFRKVRCHAIVWVHANARLCDLPILNKDSTQYSPQSQQRLLSCRYFGSNSTQHAIHIVQRKNKLERIAYAKNDVLLYLFLFSWWQ